MYIIWWLAIKDVLWLLMNEVLIPTHVNGLYSSSEIILHLLSIYSLYTQY